jgi:DNA ligase-associated metallophosphoesterase
MISRKVEIAGHRFDLLPGRAAWWERGATLLVADLHLGKTTAFRAGGIPVPCGVTSRDVSRLSGIIAKLPVRRLVVLGDLFHARSGVDAEVMDPFARLVERFRPVEWVVVEGNHDRGLQKEAESCGLIMVSDLEMDGLHFVHDPAALAGPGVCGHLHPGVRLRDFDGAAVRVPSFVVEKDKLILPAFSSFAGMHLVEPAAGRTCYAVACEKVVRVSPEGETGFVSPRRNVQSCNG